MIEKGGCGVEIVLLFDRIIWKLIPGSRDPRGTCPKVNIHRRGVVVKFGNLTSIPAGGGDSIKLMKKSICIAIAMLAAGSAFQLFAEDACPNPTLKPFQTKALEDAKTVASPDFIDHHMAFSADQAECKTEERRDNVPRNTIIEFLPANIETLQAAYKHYTFPTGSTGAVCYVEVVGWQFERNKLDTGKTKKQGTVKIWKYEGATEKQTTTSKVYVAGNSSHKFNHVDDPGRNVNTAACALK